MTTTSQNQGHILAIGHGIIYDWNGDSWLNDERSKAVGQSLELFLANSSKNEIWFLNVPKHFKRKAIFDKFAESTNIIALGNKPSIHPDINETPSLLEAANKPLTFLTQDLEESICAKGRTRYGLHNAESTEPKGYWLNDLEDSFSIINEWASTRMTPGHPLYTEKPPIDIQLISGGNSADHIPGDFADIVSTLIKPQPK